MNNSNIFCLLNENTNINNDMSIMNSNNNNNSQLKTDLEQQKAIRLQQIEAIKLIQISLDKLSSTTAVQIPTNSKQQSSNLVNSFSSKSPPTQSPPPTTTVLVYKEANLHKNLLVSKILNKAKYFYYQSIVQTMRLSLLSKLNYYSTLIQQLNQSGTSLDSGHALNETNIVDEMKMLMQQILHETNQFNLNANTNDTSLNPSLADKIQLNNIDSTSDSTFAAQEEPVLIDQNNNSIINNVASNEDQIKRIKQLNDVKLSLYSLLFTTNNNITPPPTATIVESPINNAHKRLLDQNDDLTDSFSSTTLNSPPSLRPVKRSKTNTDKINKKHRQNQSSSKKNKSIHHQSNHYTGTTNTGLNANLKNLSSVLCSDTAKNETISTMMMSSMTNQQNNHVVLGDDTNVINNYNHHNHHHHHHLHHHHNLIQ